MVPPWLHRAGIHNPPEAWTPKAVAVLTEMRRKRRERAESRGHAMSTFDALVHSDRIH